MKRRFKQVEVFGRRSFLGNPVAVILDAEGLSSEEMARIAAWTNLSETTFVLPPERGGDYRLRIFTPKEELAFGGHPTLGSAHAFLEAAEDARERRLIQECAIGLVPVTARAAGPDRRVAFESPSVSARALDGHAARRILDALRVEKELGDAPRVMDVGPRWCVCDLGDDATVERLRPDLDRLAAVSRELGLTGATVFGRSSTAARTLRVRSFAPASGVPEDPACGSGNACVAAYLSAAGRLHELGSGFTSLQGLEIGRDAEIEIRTSRDDAHGGALRITIAGRTVTLIDGTLDA